MAMNRFAPTFLFPLRNLLFRAVVLASFLAPMS
jgi:hypothetical protein